MRNIKILDTTMRDGDQTPGVNMAIYQKTEIALKLEEMGVDIIEAGFAAASSADFTAIGNISQAVSSPVVCSLARCVREDIIAASKALGKAKKPRIHVFIATSPVHMKYKLNVTEEEVLERIDSSVRFARSLCDDVQFSAEDATRSDPAFLIKALKTAFSAGASTLNIPDTVGYTMPDEYEAFLNRIMDGVGREAVYSTHCHDDLGMAVANSLAAVRCGIGQVEGTINGLGERAGNASLEEIIMALRTRRDLYDADTKIDSHVIGPISKLVSDVSGVPIPYNKPITGKNVFRHESGIHQHGMINNKTTYQIVFPEDVGRSPSRIVLGKLSGHHAFKGKVEELGYKLDDGLLEECFEEFKKIAEKKAKITDEDVNVMIRGKLDEKLLKDGYSVESFQIQSSSNLKSMAMICMKKGESSFSDAAVGNGPIDAAFNVINRISGRNDIFLDAYEISAATEGTDAMGIVNVKVNIAGKTYSGRGVSTDIIEASIKAYVNAINMAEYRNEQDE